MSIIPSAFTSFLLVSLSSKNDLALLAQESRILSVQVVSLGTVANTSTTSLAFTAPAMETALEEFAATEYVGVLNMTLTKLYNSSIQEDDAMPFYCDTMLSEWFYRERDQDADLTVFVIPGGPEDLSINYLAMNWNILLITCGSSRAIIKDKKDSPTWVTTTAFSASLMTEVYSDILERYNWTSLFVVLDDPSSPVFHSAAAAMIDEFQLRPGYQLTSATLDCFDFADTREALLQFHEISRVLLFFGHARPFRQFMIAAYVLNMTGPEYVYIVLEPYHHNMIGNFTWETGELSDKMAFEAFQSVLLLAPDDPALHQGSEALHFASDWRNVTRDEFNYTYADGEMFVPTVASSHYTMDFLAMTLKELMAIENFDFRNGTAIAEHFFNRSFSVDDEDFYMDQYGRRQMKWWSSYFDNATGTFVRYLLRDDKLQLLQDVGQVVWYSGSRLPSNEPRCGYRGFRRICQAPDDRKWMSALIVIACLLVCVPLFAGTCWKIRSYTHIDTWWSLDEGQIAAIKRDGSSLQSGGAVHAFYTRCF